MSRSREISLPDYMTTHEILEKIINLGIVKDIIQQLNLSELEKITSESLDIKSLYFNIVKIKEDKRDVGPVVLRSDVNKAWKLFCLTGQLSYIHYAYQLIQNDKAQDVINITPALQQDYNIIEAMIFVAYSGNVHGLRYLFDRLSQTNVLQTNFDLQRCILYNAVSSNKIESVKWIITNLNINVHALGIVEDIFLMAVELGNESLIRYAYEELRDPEIFFFVQLDTALISAFESGNIPAIKYVQSLGADYKSANKQGDTGLHLAAFNGHVEAMRFAVSVGIDSNSQNSKGATALHNAAANGDVSAMKCIIELGAKLDLDTHDGLGVLHFSAASGSLDAFRYVISLMDPKLVQEKLNTDAIIIKNIIQFGMGVEGIKFAVSCGLNLFTKVGQSASNLLIIAAASTYQASNKLIVQYLLDSGLRPEKNLKKTSMLHRAVYSGDQDMVYLTIKALKENQQKIDFIERDDFGASAISYAAQVENFSSMMTFLDNLNAKNNYFEQGEHNYLLAKWDYIFARIRNFLIQKGIELKENPLVIQCLQLSNDIYPLVNNSVNTEITNRLRQIRNQLIQLLTSIENNNFYVDILELIQNYLKLVNTLMSVSRKTPPGTAVHGDVIIKIGSYMDPRTLQSLLCTSSFFASSIELNNVVNRKMALQWRIILGDQHSLFLHTSGQLFGIGRNDEGQLGQADKINRNSLIPITLPDNGMVKEVVAAEAHTLVVDKEGQLFGFGQNGDGQLSFTDVYRQKIPRCIVLPNNVKVKQVVTGRDYTGKYTVVLCENKLVYSFGSNLNGQLGLGYRSDNPVTNPTLVPLPKDIIPQQLIAGGNHTFVLCNDGKLYGFGDNSQGQLGLSRQINIQSSPVLITLPYDIKPKQICAGSSHTLILCETGRLFGIGANEAGQLGIEKSNTALDHQFELISLPNNVVPLQIIAAGQTSFVIGNDKHIYAFGINRCGQLGVGDQHARFKPTRLYLYNKNPLQIATSGIHSFILCNDNSLYAFGNNLFHQLAAPADRGYLMKPFQVKILQQIKIFLKEEAMENIYQSKQNSL